MSGYLPYDRFKWWKNVDNFDVNSISEKSPVGYILEVDLEYPDKLHVLHNDYPLAPEKLAILCDIVVRLLQQNCWRVWNKSWWCRKINSKFG